MNSSRSGLPCGEHVGATQSERGRDQGTCETGKRDLDKRDVDKRSSEMREQTNGG